MPTLKYLVSSRSYRQPQFDRRLFGAMAVLALGVVFVGFAQTFYLRRWFDTEPISALRYAHGALMSCWYTLFLVQVLLVARNRVDLHRRLGVLGGLIAAAIIPMGIATGIEFIRRLHASSDAPVAAIIAGYDFVSLLVFGLLVGSALVLRRRSDVHKRLMTLASLSLLGPPLARLMSDQQSLWLTYLLVLLPVAVDTWRHHRLHPAFGWGAGLILITSQASLHYAASAEWIHFALRTFA
jgi:hypothetical protein